MALTALLAGLAPGLLAVAAHSSAPPAQEPESPAAEPPPLELRVNRAIARGVQHLRERQTAEGRWLGDESRYPGGLTAFVAYTLAKSGVRQGDPDLRRSLEALAGIEPRSTYGTSARLMLYASLRDRERWTRSAQACLDSLVSFQREGLWGYPEDPIDLSNVQFALLGLWSAREMGLAVPEPTLVACARAIWRFQEREGGFHYRPDSPATAGITAATLCGIAILEAFGADHAALLGVLRKHEKERAAAHQWLVRHWDPERNAWGPNAWTPSWHFPYLWAVERYCELTGRVELGGRDWYREGAEHLIERQEGDGGWGSVENTCFALLFLRRTTFSGGTELGEIDAEIDADPTANPPSGPQLDPSAPHLTDWLVAGPFLGKPGATGLRELPFEPRRARPRERGRVGGKRWERIRLKDTTWTDLEQVTGRSADHCVWALATRLTVSEGVERKELEALLWFAFEDGWRVFLDGREISSATRVQAPIVYDVLVPLRLTPGTHELLVVSEDALGSAAFGARVSDPGGRPPGSGLSWGAGSRRR